MPERPNDIMTSLVQSPVLTLFARSMQVIVLPVLVFLFMQLWNGLDQSRAEFRTFDRRVTVIETRLTEIDRRLGEQRR